MQSLIVRTCFVIWICLGLDVCHGEHVMNNERRLHNMYSLHPKFANVESLKTTASDPWPHTPQDDNLCNIKKLKVIIIMASDRGYYEKMLRCMDKGQDSVSVNSKYADQHEYSLRMYIDDDIPFIMKHEKNSLAGELRKLFAMADASHPQGPKFGYWTTNKKETNPDLVMWVDGDATLYSNSIPTISIEEVIRRTCLRAEYPSNYVRVVGQDFGGNVNAGWYIIGTGVFGSHLLSYLLELAEIYDTCGMWGQHMIQEALLMVMGGTPPPWNFVLPCTGEKYGCFKESTLHTIKNECNHTKECVIHKANMYVNITNYHKLKSDASSLNGCFSEKKYDYVPNAYDNYQRSQLAINYQKSLLKPGEVITSCDENCCGYNSFPSPQCNLGDINRSNPEELANFNKTTWWAASGAGIVLLPALDPEVKFNVIRVHTELLWHHGHGRLFKANCE